MIGEVQTADLVDPLHGFSVLSLLPRTCKGFKKSLNPEQGDMEFIQSCLKLMESESSVKLVEQAKAICDKTLEVKDSEYSQNVPVDGEDTMVSDNGKDRPQERRPALGRKRARFSLKPNASQPSLAENVSLNIDLLQDPEDFFLAYEKLENAKKELQKQRGENLADVTKHNLSTTARVRRPGLLGKTAGYKHRYSSVLGDSDEAFVSSQQEEPEVEIPNQSNNLITERTNDVASYRPDDVNQGTGSVDKGEEKGSRLLDELLSTNCSNLDKDGAVTFLQERLQIKPFNLDKLCLPNMDSLRKNNSKAVVDQRGPRKALSDIHNKLRRVSTKATTEVHQAAERSMLRRASPAPSKSPLSSMALLNKHLSKIDKPVNPFSFDGIDISPATDCSPAEGTEKYEASPKVDPCNSNSNDTTSQELIGKDLSFSGRFQSLMHEEGKSEDGGKVAGLTVTENLADKPVISADDRSNGLYMDTNSSSIRSDNGREISPNITRGQIDANDVATTKQSGKGLNSSGSLQPRMLEEESIAVSNNVSGKSMTENVVCAPDSSMLQTSAEACTVASGKLVSENLAQSHDMPTDENLNRIDTGVNKRSSEPDGVLKDKDEDMHLEAGAEEPELDLEKSQAGVDHDSSQLDESAVTVGEYRPKDGCLQSAEILLEQNNEKPQESPTVSVIERSKKKKSSSAIRVSKQSSVHKSLGDQSESISGKHHSEDGDSQHDNIHPEQNTEAQKKSSTISKSKNGRSKKQPQSNKSKRKGNSNQKNITDQLDPTPEECCAEDESLQSANMLPERVNETHREHSRFPLKKQKEPVHYRRREVSCEKSLEGAGTVWESGIRKITRKRQRPLEYWKGERFLYARVHDSLASVIGLKYESPAKAVGQKPALRVKPFGSDEYKELVELTNWH